MVSQQGSYNKKITGPKIESSISQFWIALITQTKNWIKLKYEMKNKTWEYNCF